MDNYATPESHDMDYWYCPHCGHQARDWSCLNLHVMQEHPPPQSLFPDLATYLYKSEIQTAVALTRERLEKETYEPAYLYECLSCSFSCVRRDHFNRHVQRKHPPCLGVHPKALFFCPGCKYTATRANDLRIHVNRMHEVRDKHWRQPIRF